MLPCVPVSFFCVTCVFVLCCPDGFCAIFSRVCLCNTVTCAVVPWLSYVFVRSSPVGFCAMLTIPSRAMLCVFNPLTAGTAYSRVFMFY